jgi:hypothetical protein
VGLELVELGVLLVLDLVLAAQPEGLDVLTCLPLRLIGKETKAL